MFHSVGRIMRWAGAYRKRMVLGFVCSFFATWCTAGPVVLAAWALGQLIVDAWGEERLSPHLPWLCLGGIVVLILLRFFFTYWKNRLQESIGTERAAEQRMELGNVLKRVSLGYFAKNDLGDILAALTTELSTLELQSMKMVDAVVNGYIQVAVILLCVAFFCPPAALAALIGVLVSAFALRGIGRQSARTAPVSHRAQGRPLSTFTVCRWSSPSARMAFLSSGFGRPAGQTRPSASKMSSALSPGTVCTCLLCGRLPWGWCSPPAGRPWPAPFPSSIS